MYEEARIAVDPVIFTIKNQKLLTLLHQREKPPFQNKHELPGGLLRKNEKPEKRLKTKLKEMTGKQNIYFDQFSTFTQPNRDPRQRTISIGYIALINQEKIQNPENWHNARNLPKTAFDHKKIIQKAEQHLQQNLDTVIAKQFLPKHFPFNDLQKAYETIKQKQYDNRNFRRKMKNQNIVEKTDKKQQNVSHRPATLYKFKN